MSRSRRALRSAVVPAAFASALVIISLLDYCQVDAFRISFGHRIVKSAQQHSNPQLNPPDTLIRPIECRNANNRSETGICMFSIDCMQNKGVPLSVCKHNYFVGTCCKLPDHNNFVGIVYDLRETETANQQLEARRSAASGQLVAGPPANATQPLLIKQAAPTAIAGDEDEQRQASGHKPTSTTTSSGPSQTSDSNDRSSPATSATIKSHLERRSTVSQPSESPGETSPANLATTPTGAPPTIQTTPASPSAQLAEKLLDEKYIISSTKLFQSPSSVASSSTSTTASPLQQAPSVVLFPSSSITVETARNSDGSSQAGHSQQQQQQQQQHGPQNGSIAAHVAYEGASGELRDSPVLSSGVYEILASGEKSDELPAPSFHQNVSDLSQGTLLSSAHSAPGRLNSQQSSVYLLADETDSAQKNVPTSIVFSSNHQQQAGEPLRHQQQQQQTSSPAPPFSDQEFALSTSGGAQEAGSSSISSLVYSSTLASQPSTASQATGQPTSPDGTLASSPASPSSLSLASAGGSADSSSPSHQAYEATSSPYVDLVSSQHHSTAQTTTPFTSSLSTAILPNISSHPYAPTTLAPASSPASQALVSSTSSVGSNKQPQPLLPAGQDVSSFAPLHSSVSPLFYSTSSQAAHSSTSTRGDSDAAAAVGHSPAHSSRPGGSAGLQAASKIVTSNSASNNLIPGLSGLQSAIMSHIPFKIASGLSSGLTSYLQAAMKPTSGHNRPLISSNTAPALQYQQQQHHSNATSANHANNKLVASAVVQPSVQQGAVRFPAPASASTTSSSSVPAPPAAERDVLREAQLVCGKPQVSPHEVLKKRVARIVGGNQSSFGQWPWMVSLRQWRKGAFLHKCGAALLNENWAITAAHCVENVKAPDLLLRLGEFDVSNQNEPYPYTERRVKSVVSHPSFDPKTFEYDLALIRFTEPVQYERNIVPVCVPAGNDSFVDRMATVIGWGRLYEDGPLPDVIQHVNVPIITNQECEKMYKNAGFVEEIPDMFICAGISKGGRDSCEGDSGGPLTMIDHDGRSYLVGIISWGIGCALPSQPGVYTRITAFSPWINSILST